MPPAAPPLTASPDTLGTTLDTPLTVPTSQLLANDTAPSGQGLLLTNLSNSQNGTVTLDQSHGTVTFTPATGFTGAASFQYQVTDTHGDTAQAAVAVNVAPATQPPPPPTANNATLFAPQNLTTTVLANELLAGAKASVPSDHLILAGVSSGQHGTVALIPGGSASFTPDPGFTGTASFGFTVADQFGSTAQAGAAVNVTPYVQPVSNSPLEFKTAFDTPLSINADQLTAPVAYSPIWAPYGPSVVPMIDYVGGAQGGSVTFDRPSGQIVFTPDKGSAGTASFTWAYESPLAGASRVQVDVAPPPAPSAGTDTLTANENTAMVIPASQLLANDRTTVPSDDPLHIAAVSSAQHATVSLTPHGNVNFSPDNGFAGVATFTYTVADNFHQSATGAVAVTVQPAPQPQPPPPTAVPPPPPPVMVETQVIEQTQQVAVTQIQQLSVTPITIVQQPPANPATPALPAALVYFDGTSQAHGSELWSFNGQTVGEVADINPGPGSSFPADLQANGPTLFFSADDGTHGRQPWTFDGQSAKMLADLNPAGSSDPQDFTEVRVAPPLGTALPATSEIYFSATNGTDGRQLWVADQSGKVHMVTDINAGAVGSNPSNLTALDGNLYFTADDGVHGSQLWTVGSTGKAVELTTLNSGTTGAAPGDLTVVGDALYFIANDGVHGRELFSVSNGGQPVEQLVNPGTGGAFPAAGGDHSLVAIGDKLYFVANVAGQGNVLMSESEGATVPQTVASLGAGPTASLGSVQAAAAGHDLYFAVTNGNGTSQLARYDTTTGILTPNIAPDNTDMPANLTAAGNQMFFTVLNHTIQGDVQFRDLYSDNGVTTQKVALGGTQTLPHDLTAANGMLFFADQGQLEQVNPTVPPLAATTLTVAGGQIYVPLDIAAAPHALTPLG